MVSKSCDIYVAKYQDLWLNANIEHKLEHIIYYCLSPTQIIATLEKKFK